MLKMFESFEILKDRFQGIQNSQIYTPLPLVDKALSLQVQYVLLRKVVHYLFGPAKLICCLI